MCGIIGIVSAYNNGFSQPEIDAFNKMLYLDALRGFDSTGVFAGDKSKNVLILKEASPAPIFMGRKEYQDFTDKLRVHAKFSVGHNRAATRGNIEDKNAHPFWVEDKIVLVQNGTWYGDHKKIKETDVDTEVVAHLIAEHEDVKEALHKIDAAYALVWFDVKNNQLNFVRNAARPLWFAHTKSGAMLFCSEPETIRYAVDKANWKYDKEPFQIAENILFRLSFDKTGDYTTKNIDVAKKTSVTYPLVTWPGGAAGNAPFRRSQTQQHHGGGTDDITFSFLECYQPDASVFFEDASAQHEYAQTALDYFNRKNSSGSGCVVELEDYHPANSHQHCRTFHFCGRLQVTVTPNPYEKIVCYWTITGMTEEEALTYVSRGHYLTKFNGLHSRKLVEGSFLVARMTNPVLAFNLETGNALPQ